MENVFGSIQVYGESWQVTARRKFNDVELNAVRNTEVVPSKYGKSVCFFMKAGGTTYIPMSQQGVQLNEGESVDLTKCELLTLERTGDSPIMRVEVKG